MDHPPDDQKLSTRTKLFYGVGDVGNAVVNSAIQFFLMLFYTDGALIAPALASSALLIGKLWDGVNDPLLGWLSDRTTSPRFGKRRVFMIFGAIPLGLSVMLLWIVPSGLTVAGVFIWIAVTFILFDTLWTATNVPYYSLTSELTEDYDERASLTASRMALAVPAYLVGAALTPVLAGMFADRRTGFAVVGIVYGLLAALALLVSAAGLREKARTASARAHSKPWASLATVFRNRPFVRLITAYLVINLAFALVKTLMAYFLIYQLKMESQVSAVMGLMLVSVALFLFVWKRLSDRWNKGPAYALGMAIGGLTVAASFFLPHHSTAWVYALAFFAGLGFSAQWVFPWAMVPDVADFDRLETGEYRSGMYFGVWGLATKLSEALGIAGTGWVLTLFGYVANAEQTPQALLGIRLFFGPIPAALILLSLPLLIWYPITRKSHQAVQQALAARDQLAPLPAPEGAIPEGAAL